MADRDLKFNIKADATGLSTGLNSAKQGLEKIRDIGDVLRGTFQSFASGRALAVEFGKAMEGSASSIAAVAGQVANLSQGVMLGFKQGGPIGAGVAILVAGLGILTVKMEEARKKAEEFRKATQSAIEENIKLIEASNKSAKAGVADRQLKEIKQKYDLLRAQVGDDADYKIIIDDAEANEKIEALRKRIIAMSSEFATSTGKKVGITGGPLINDILKSFTSTDIMRSSPGGGIIDLINKWGPKREDFGKSTGKFDQAQKEFLDTITTIVKGFTEFSSDSQKLLDDINTLQNQIVNSKAGAERLSKEAGVANPKEEKDIQVESFSTSTEYLTDELRKIGGYIGNVGTRTMTNYETNSLNELKKINTQLGTLVNKPDSNSNLK
jgi:hypothetical protein